MGLVVCAVGGGGGGDAQARGVGVIEASCWRWMRTRMLWDQTLVFTRSAGSRWGGIGGHSWRVKVLG